MSKVRHATLALAILVLITSSIGIPKPITVHAVSDQGSSDQIDVYVGYADDLRSNPFFPDPWCGSPGVIFVGSCSSIDAGVVRVDNIGTSNVTVSSVSVLLPGPLPSLYYCCRPITINYWPGYGGASGSVVIPPGRTLILSQTGPETGIQDTSDYNFNSCGNSASIGFEYPIINVTTAKGTQEFDDKGHTLDTEGFDLACQGNESLQWRPAHPPFFEGNPDLEITPFNATNMVGTTHKLTATLVSNITLTPVVNTTVTIAVTGANPLTGYCVTNSTGKCSFSYTGTNIGVDTIAGSAMLGNVLVHSPLAEKIWSLQPSLTFECLNLGFKAIQTACALPNAKVGTPYEYSLQVTGGFAPYTWSVASGVFPQGLFLNPSTGIISGTSTLTGVHVFNLKIVDSTQLTLSLQVTLAVTPIITDVSPYLLGVSPRAGPQTGGTPVDISGLGFQSATSVRFGFTNVSCGLLSSCHVQSDSLIHIDSTPSVDRPGMVNVGVVVNGFTSGAWCQTYSLPAGSPVCYQFLYLPRTFPLACSSSRPGGLVSLPPVSTGELDFKPPNLPEGVDVTLTGSATLSPQAGFCVSATNFQLHFFNFTAVMDASASLTATVSSSISYDNTQNPFVLGKPLQGAPLVAALGIVPIVIVPTLTPVLTIQTGATATVGIGVSHNSRTAFGIRYKPNETPPLQAYIPTVTCTPDPTTQLSGDLANLCFQPLEPTITVHGTVKIAIGVEFGLLFYDLAGPFVRPDVYLRLDAAATTTQSAGPMCSGVTEGSQTGVQSWGALCGGVEVSVGGELAPLGYPLAGFSAKQFDLGSALLAATVSVSPFQPITLKTGQTVTITSTVAGSTPPNSAKSSSASWFPSWSASCGTLSQTTQAVKVTYTAPSVPGVCNVQVKQNAIFPSILGFVTTATITIIIQQ